jgi:GAF domain-containing protein
MEEEENLTTHLAPFAATALEMSTLRERQRERERERERGERCGKVVVQRSARRRKHRA